MYHLLYKSKIGGVFLASFEHIGEFDAFIERTGDNTIWAKVADDDGEILREYHK